MNGEIGVLYYVFVTNSVSRFAINLRIARISIDLKIRKSGRNLKTGKISNLL